MDYSLQSLSWIPVLDEKRLLEVELVFDDAAQNCKVVAWRRSDDGSLEEIHAVVCVS
jgi:hypothetical protein